MLPLDVIRALPKTDLHVHLDGSLREATLIELARERGVKLPSETVEGLNELVFRPHYASLAEYLHGFALTGAVMKDAEALERIAYELAWDNIHEGVRYIEVRFAPWVRWWATRRRASSKRPASAHPSSTSATVSGCASAMPTRWTCRPKPTP